MPDIPTNNIELYLANIAGESEQTPDFPTNQIERYLAKIAAGGGGGGGGTDDYTDLSNKPQINSNTLSGNKTAAQLGLAPAVVEVTNSDTAPSIALDAGKIYHFTGALTALTIDMTTPASGQIAHYHFDFDSGSTAPTLTLPNDVTMPSGFTVEASKHYEIDILNGYGAVMAW